MFQKLHLASSLLFGAIAAISFAIPMIYFINSAKYQDTWLLFLGNFFFLLVVAVYMLVFTKKKYENPNTSLLLTAGHVVTVIGVVISCILAFITLMIFDPSLIGFGQADLVLENSPAWTDGGKRDGMLMFVFMVAVVGNVSAGSAVSIFLAYTTKKDQTKEEVIDRVKVDTKL